MTLARGAARAPEEVLLGFARALRAAGVAVSAERERTYLEAVAEIGLDDPVGTYHAGRATMCASPTDLDRYDLVYAAWFGLEVAGTKPRATPPAISTMADLAGDSGAGGGEDEQHSRTQQAVASRTEVLRHRDLATTAVYAKVDRDTLRTLAQPWPAGAR